MIKIERNGKENIDSMLKRFKNKCHKVKLVKELNERKEHIKKSIKNREIKNKAIYIEKKYNQDK